MSAVPFRLYSVLFALLALACICSDPFPDFGNEGEETGPYPSDSHQGCNSTSETGPTGFSVSGVAANLLNPTKVSTEGLCVYAADPSACLAGPCNIMDYVLAEGVVGAGGAYTLTDIDAADARYGLLFLVQDCGTEGTVMPTATGMGLETYQDLANGATISDYTIYSLDVPAATGFQALLAAAGYAGDLSIDGALMGWVLDSAGNPIEDAVVTGPAGCTIYCFGGMFIIPGAPIYRYACTAEGYTFDDVIAGSLPGYAVFFKFTAL